MVQPTSTTCIYMCLVRLVYFLLLQLSTKSTQGRKRAREGDDEVGVGRGGRPGRGGRGGGGGGGRGRGGDRG